MVPYPKRNLSRIAILLANTRWPHPMEIYILLRRSLLTLISGPLKPAALINPSSKRGIIETGRGDFSTLTCWMIVGRYGQPRSKNNATYSTRFLKKGVFTTYLVRAVFRWLNESSATSIMTMNSHLRRIQLLKRYCLSCHSSRKRLTLL